MLIYATLDDLGNWMTPTDTPDNAAVLLRSASGLVAEYTAGSFYTVDVNGYPTDVPTKQALNDATCAQAALWAALKIDPTAGAAGVNGPVSSKKIGSANLSYSVVQQQAQARLDAATTLCEESQRILRLAGMAPTHVWSFG